MPWPRVAALLGAALIASVVGDARAEDRPALLEEPYSLPDFLLTERDGRSITRADLAGHVWVAAFVFTRCAGPCWQVSTHMARLQHDVIGRPDLGGVRLVSVTVDPEFDTPAVLGAYADKFGAVPGRWLFLTGPRRDVYDLIGDGFHLSAHYNNDPRAGAGYRVDHSTRLALVDTHGRVRGYFDGTDAEDLPRLERAASRLVWEDRLPAVNATLNGLAALLLVLGYAAIRRGRTRLHATLMLTALAVSALFLVSYLTYHVVIKAGHSTPFTGQGWVRPAYFGLLLSHILLAAIVLPLAVTTAMLGLRGRLAQHVRLARWTLPLWLYVSVTGVLVYWMLYHLYPAA